MRCPGGTRHRPVVHPLERLLLCVGRSPPLANLVGDIGPERESVCLCLENGDGLMVVTL